MPAEQEPPLGPALEALVEELRRPVAPAGRAPERALAMLASERRQRVVWPLAAAIALMLGLSLFRGRPADAQPVRFALRAPPTARVALIGDFNDWDPSRSPLRRGGEEWAGTVRLKPGRYRYAFVVDGSHWVADPNGAAVPDDDFGTPTSVITIAR